jgi:Fic family protein
VRLWREYILKMVRKREALVFIHERPGWTQFTWDAKSIAGVLSHVRLRQGTLLGKMQGYGFSSRWEATLKVLTEETMKSSAIEGVVLDPKSVRSSMARRLHLEAGGLQKKEDRNVEGVVEMMVNATQNYKEPLTRERLWGWHNDLFPTGFSGMRKIRVATWRDDKLGPMQVDSTKGKKENVHFVAPPAKHIDSEMAAFLDWFNGETQGDPLLKAAIAHLWFVTIHPFEDGNGRITRAISELSLARSDNSEQRFCSMSSRISDEKPAYYRELENAQKGSTDITAWLLWFLRCLDRAIEKSNALTDSALEKDSFWGRLKSRSIVLNDRQKKVVNKCLNGFEGKLTAEKWEKITKCSRNTALRDIVDLEEKGLLVRNPEGGRSTSYRLTKVKPWVFQITSAQLAVAVDAGEIGCSAEQCLR